MSYTTRMAAALSGATLSQLRHWRSPRTGPLLAPEIKSTPGVMYSFRDVLALRTFVRLRQDASLQRIRLAIGNLRNLGEIEHLASYKFVSDSASNIQLVTDEDAVDLVRHPGQRQLLISMGDVIEPFGVREASWSPICSSHGTAWPLTPTPRAVPPSSPIRACLTTWSRA